MSILKTFITLFKRKTVNITCEHEFKIEDLVFTRDFLPKMPPDVKFKRTEGMEPFDPHSERVRWPCCKCDKVFHAHCGLDIVPKHGKYAQ